jgi:FMN reductase
VLLGATAGTARHSLVVEFAMRPLFAYLRAVPVPTGVLAANEDWAGGGKSALVDRIDRAAAELADVLFSRPVARKPADPFADPVTSFEELLKGH